ncbi:T9SS type A sorting domain-containing protein [Botryobacter ruber]|uniref:T9SS type A sorting domain-containing protein n=1 Tax=Botryobacter ruber TaxID=2171629 RepID=UPI000E0A3996|nr:T9SS type A sorting domain-containing protein [Botryobacter ruber]
MKIKNLLALVCLIVGINTISFGQTNLMANWAGPDGLGGGAATEYGWAVRTGEGGMDEANHVVWNTANASSGVRYRDVDASTNPQTMRDGAVWSGRVLYLRWDAGSNTINYVFSYPVQLQAGTSYRFSMLYQWWSNGNAPTYTVGISRDMAGTDNVTTQQFFAETRNVMQSGEITFTAPSTGTYYITFKSNQAVLGGFSNFSLVATTTTSAAKDLAASGYSIYPNPSNRTEGLRIAATGANESARLYIYNTTGQVLKQLTINAAQDKKVDISDLSAGMYVAKVVTSKGVFSKSLVVQ